jgi:hypothetical protein
VRSALSKVAGIYELKTDLGARTCEFKAAKDLDVKAKLDELASSNEHLAKWSAVEGLQ